MMTPTPPPDYDAIDQRIDEICKGAALVSPKIAFQVLGIKSAFGFELLAAGILERIHVGRSSRVSVSSIKRVAKYGAASPQAPVKAAKAAAKRRVRHPS